MGTQVLYDSGYDPRAMAQFFESWQEAKGKILPSFSAITSNQDHRLERVDEEVQKLGGTPPNARRDSKEFEAAKREVMTLPVPPKKTKAGTAPSPAANAPAGPPAVPSEK
jgi:predicted Zn-dependent protease